MQESALLAAIAARSADLSAAYPDIVVGPGDDCAVLREPGGSLLVIGVDQLVAGRHFKDELLTTREGLTLVGRKAVARAVSDIAAMGAEPVWGLATGLLPSDFEHGDQLFDAMAAAARTFNCPLVGGDIAACPPDQPLSLTVTAAGRMPVGVEPVLRSGAQPGDQLWLTGLIGNSYTSGRHLTFEPRVTLGKLAATTPGVRAMMDISDGLGIDADRIARASNIIIDIDLDAVPLHADVTDPLQACADGEDYELLIAAAPTLDLASMNDQFRGPIGVAQAPSDGEQPHAAIVTDGKRHLGARLGWDHGQESHDA